MIEFLSNANLKTGELKRGSPRMLKRGESSHVEAWGSSHVEAWGSSHVEAWGLCAIHNHSSNTTLELLAFSAAWLIAKTKMIKRHGQNTSIIIPENTTTLEKWMEDEGLQLEKDTAIIFKRVSKEWKTQEGTVNETVWTPGNKMNHPSYNPTEEECGTGKYHACSHAYFCDEFRSTPDDRYIAIQVRTKDMYIWPNATYPHKVAFKAGKVLFECDRYGKKID